MSDLNSTMIAGPGEDTGEMCDSRTAVLVWITSNAGRNMRHAAIDIDDVLAIACHSRTTWWASRLTCGEFFDGIVTESSTKTGGAQLIRKSSRRSEPSGRYRGRRGTLRHVDRMELSRRVPSIRDHPCLGATYERRVLSTPILIRSAGAGRPEREVKP